MSFLTKRPLALLSLGALFMCWLLIYQQVPGNEPEEDLVLSVAFTELVAFCPLFNLAKGLSRSPLGRHWPTSLILSVPSAGAVLVVLWDMIYPASAWLGAWFIVQFVVLPVTWAIGRSYWEDAAPISNRSFRPAPLRSAACTADDRLKWHAVKP